MVLTTLGMGVSQKPWFTQAPLPVATSFSCSTSPVRWLSARLLRHFMLLGETCCVCIQFAVEGEAVQTWADHSFWAPAWERTIMGWWHQLHSGREAGGEGLLVRNPYFSCMLQHCNMHWCSLWLASWKQSLTVLQMLWQFGSLINYLHSPPRTWKS